VGAPRWYTVAQAAELLGEKPATISKRCSRGHYPLQRSSPGRGRPYKIRGAYLRAILTTDEGR
jgi:hypothetical protein